MPAAVADNGRGDKPLPERVGRLEWELEQVETRLDKGAQAFSDIRNEHQQLRDAVAPKPTPTWKVIAVGLTVITLLAGWVWQAAKYPNRDEFDTVRREVNTLKLDQVKIQKDIESIKASQERVEDGIGVIQTDIRSYVANSLAAPPVPPKKKQR